MHAERAAGAGAMPDEAGATALDGISNDGRHLTLAAIERQAIEGRMLAYNGRKKEVAHSLGIALNTLLRRLSEYSAADAGTAGQPGRKGRRSANG